MMATVKKILLKLVDTRLIPFYKDYLSTPGVLYKEFINIIKMIYYKRRFINDPEVLLAALRTSAHVLDKSLQAEDWEMGHGHTEYEALCNSIDQLKHSTIRSDPSFQWALAKKREFEEAQQNKLGYGEPFLHSEIGVTKEQLLQVIQNRRSIRSFTEKEIEPEIMKELADVVSWSPTSCNRQPARLFITQNPEKISKCLQQCAGATCLGDTIPCFIAVCADTRFYMIKDRNLPFIDTSLGIQNMLLIAHIQGIEGVPLNWMHHTRREDKILRQTLGIPDYYMVVLNLILGYPKRSVPIPGRKNSDLALTWIA